MTMGLPKQRRNYRDVEPDWANELPEEIADSFFKAFDPREGGLFWGKKPTNMYKHLLQSSEPEGANVTSMGNRSYGRDFNHLLKLESLGWVKCKPTGPRGGRCWHATPLGLDKLREAKEYLINDDLRHSLREKIAVRIREE